MEATTYLKTMDKAEWESAAREFSDYNYMQLWGYCIESAAKVGADIEFVAIYSENELIGLSGVRIKRIAYSGIGIAYVVGGPLVRNGATDKKTGDQFGRCIRALTTEYVKKRKLVLRVRSLPCSEEENLARSKYMEDHGVQEESTTDIYRTFVMDISGDLDQIKANFKGKWRNCLNSSLKNDIEIVTGSSTDLFDVFEGLFAPLRQKKGFKVNLGSDFYKKVQERVCDEERFYFHLAKKNDQLLSVHVGSYLGDTAVYLLGASTSEGNSLKASYLLQWNAIQYAKSQNCTNYDLGGIDPEINKGVYHFKKGMNGVDVTAAGPTQFGSTFKIKLLDMAEKSYRQYKILKNRNAE